MSASLHLVGTQDRPPAPTATQPSIRIVGNRHVQPDDRCRKCQSHCVDAPGAQGEWEACLHFRKWLTYPAARTTCEHFAPIHAVEERAPETATAPVSHSAVLRVARANSK